MRQDGPVILLVEDSDSDAMLIEQAFRKARVRNQIIRVSTGREAISYLEGSGAFSDRTEPLFILLDLLLPDISGYELLRWVRNRPQSRDLPAVIVTGSDHPLEAQTSDALGANAFFRKSLVFEDLVQMVRAIGANWSLRTDLTA